MLVVSRGDDELLALDGRRGVHFPHEEPGVYAGHYPVDSAAAIDSPTYRNHSRAAESRARGSSFW